MTQEKPQTLDLHGEYIEHVHLLSSDRAGWEGLHLVCEREPAGEMPETALNQHAIVICLAEVRASFEMEGRWQHRHYTAGDIAIFPASNPLPKTQFDRDVPLIELFLDPRLFVSATDNAIEACQLAIEPNLQVRDSLIYQMGLALTSELAASGADSRLYAESMAGALSVHLLRRYGSQSLPTNKTPGGLPPYKLKTAIAYIQEHLHQPIALAELAAVARMSPRYFASLFKQSTGVTPYQYVLQSRIDRAKSLLRRSDLSLVEIAHRVGFQNQSHFTRIFRQYVNATPKAYRDRL